MTHQPDPAAFLPAHLHASRRQDGWSAANQRAFLEAIAEGRGVDAACLAVGLSASSAYAFRRTAKGAAFSLGWRAASLVARDVVAETLMVRALEGQVETIVRADGSSVTRHRYDNRLAMSLLARLDRQVEATPDADVKAARLVAQEFDAFLDLVGKDEGPARAGLFLARRADGLGEGATAASAHDLAPIYALAAADRLVRTGVATAAEIDIADLDPTARDDWTAEQWRRADAAGLFALATPAVAADTAPVSQHSQHSPADLEPVWWDEGAEEWRPSFPPPAGFEGQQSCRPGHEDYERTLTAEEERLIEWEAAHRDAAVATGNAQERDAFFAALRAAHDAGPADGSQTSVAADAPAPVPA